MWANAHSQIYILMEPSGSGRVDRCLRRIMDRNCSLAFLPCLTAWSRDPAKIVASKVDGYTLNPRFSTPTKLGRLDSRHDSSLVAG
jgi:hypothetical protein